VEKFEQLVCGLPADADVWANVIGTMVSEPASPLLVVGSAGQAVVIFLFWLLTLTRGLATIFSKKTCFPKILEPIKQHLKIIKF
jgi:hypothetical protein